MPGGDNVYDVQVTVTDSGPDGSLTDFQDIAITVTDENEETPDLLYLSSSSGGNVDGIVFADEDILTYDTVNDVWNMFFDGSDVGLSGGLDVDAFHVTDTGSVLLSLSQTATVAGLGTVQDEDVIEFTPTSTGDTTAGSFSLIFDGSDFELNANGEDVDAVTLDANGDLIISLTANYSVDAVGGGTLSGGDEDLILFDATAQAFEMYFDGSDVSMNGSSEDITGAFVDTTNGEVYLTTLGNYGVAGLTGDADDVFVFAGTTGDPTSGTFSAFFNGDTAGVPAESLDGVSIAPAPSGGSGDALIVHNLELPQDVNGDGAVTTFDALLVLNVVTATAEGEFNSTVRHFTDVNGDRVTTPLDALQVINFMQSESSFTPANNVVAAPSDEDDATNDDVPNDSVLATGVPVERVTSADSPTNVTAGSPDILALSSDATEDDDDDLLTLLAEDQTDLS